MELPRRVNVYIISIFFVQYDTMSKSKEQNLRVFIGVTAALHFIQFIVVVSLKYGKHLRSSFPLHVNYATWPEKLDAAKGFVNVSTGHYPVDLGWCVAAFFLLSSVFQFLSIIPFFWNNYVRSGVHPLRWIEYSVSASCLILTAAVVVGIDDLHFILLFFFANFTVMMLGLIQEGRAHMYRALVEANKTKPRGVFDFIEFLLPHGVGWVLYAVIWYILYDKFTLASNHGTKHPPTIVQAFYAINLILFAGFGILQFVQMYLYYNCIHDQRFGRMHVYLINCEWVYAAFSLITKTFAAWFLYAGVLATSKAVL